MIDQKISIIRGKPIAEYEWCENSLFNNIFLSLFVRKGSWFHNLQFGSELHLIKKITDKSIKMAEQTCRDTLNWLITIGRAVKIDVSVNRIPENKNAIGIYVSVQKPDASVDTFSWFYSVI